MHDRRQVRDLLSGQMEAIAQLVERLIVVQMVSGSNPLGLPTWCRNPNGLRIMPVKHE